MLENNSTDPEENPVLNEMLDATPDLEAPLIVKKKYILLRVVLAVLIFGSGLGSGFLLWGRSNPEKSTSIDLSKLADEINPKDGFTIPAEFGDIGPDLVAAGAIDFEAFKQLYEQSGQPLSDQDIEVLSSGSQDQIVITRENSHFLLNLFWALGLTNKNPILESGPIQQLSEGQIDQFASTGGWTVGTKPVTDLYSSSPILSLTSDQQARVDEVAKAVYRPCCDNPTHFPDCNHGMAMLGLLELMASQDATTEEMFQAAKNVNAFWFPQQTLEQAIYFKMTEKLSYKDIDARSIVGQQVSSASGFQRIHQWLSENGLLEQSSSGGNNCGV
jgi:hypothetical protein